MQTNAATMNSNYKVEWVLVDLKDDDFQKAKDQFLFYTAQNVIHNCSYEDAVWHLSDQVSRYNFRYPQNHLGYEVNYKPFTGYDLEFFNEILKLFIVNSMGSYSLNTLRSFLHYINQMLSIPIASLGNYDYEPKLYSLANDFFDILPIKHEETRNCIIDRLDEIGQRFFNTGKCQRTLADFSSYLIFSEILHDYWKTEITEAERLFYYPLFLWFEITCIVPTRVTEFILTPRDCIISRNEKTYLKLRKNVIKGSNKHIQYNIDDDYTINEYQIPDTLAHEIRNYIALTNKYSMTQLETLFLTFPHYNKWHRSENNPEIFRYLTYTNLRTILRYFYDEIINHKYGYRVLYHQEEYSMDITDKNISYIRLGDTRHIAMYNIIANGGSLLHTMLLAGHSNVEMSSHYYANLGQAVMCRTLSTYQKYINGTVDTLPANIGKPIQTGCLSVLPSGDYCKSPHYHNGNYTDCENAYGPNAEIGFCPVCRFFTRKEEVNDQFSSSIHVIAKDPYAVKLSEKITRDCSSLLSAVKKYRAFKGESDDILRKELILESSINDLESYTLGVLQRGNDHGT